MIRVTSLHINAKMQFFEIANKIEALVHNFLLQVYLKKITPLHFHIFTTYDSCDGCVKF